MLVKFRLRSCACVRRWLEAERHRQVFEEKKVKKDDKLGERGKLKEEAKWKRQKIVFPRAYFNAFSELNVASLEWKKDTSVWSECESRMKKKKDWRRKTKINFAESMTVTAS